MLVFDTPMAQDRSALDSLAYNRRIRCVAGQHGGTMYMVWCSSNPHQEG